MKNNKVFWLIVGIVLIVAGIILLDVHIVPSIISFIAGIAVLMLMSISWMRVSGGVKENYCHLGGGSSEKFSPDDTSAEEKVNVWDQISGENGDAK